MKKLTMILLGASALALAGCGETISQSATGGGSNTVVTGDGGSVLGQSIPASSTVSSATDNTSGLPVCDGTSQTAEAQGRCVAP